MYIKVFALSIVLFFTALIFSPVQAQSINAKGRVGLKNLSQTLGEKLVNINLVSVSEDTGNIFMLIRNSKKKTRDLEWVLYSSVKNKVIKTGACPFKMENHQVSVSNDSKYACAFSALPSALWVLDIENSKWSKVYENPSINEAGLAIRNPADISPLIFIKPNVIASILEDYKIKDGAKKMDNIASVFAKVNEDKVNKSVSLKDVMSKSIPTLTAVDKKRKITSGPISIMDVDEVACVLRSHPTKEEFLITLKKGQEPVVVASVKGSVKYIDYNTSLKTLLYSVSENKKESLMFLKDGKNKKLFDVVTLSGKVTDDGRLALVLLNPSNNRVDFVIATAGQEKLIKLLSFSKVYRFSIARSGKQVTAIAPDEILWYEIAGMKTRSEK